MGELMGIGILVCGLNGSGKSTFGKALSEKLNYHFIDNEDLYFPKTDPDYPYAFQRSDSEVEELLMNEVIKYKNFVFAAVRGDCGKDIFSYYNYAVLIDVPKEIRMQRVRNRSYQKFGDRILKGGDLYEHEEEFFRFTGARTEKYVETWAQTLKCPMIRIDGTKPIEKNITAVIKWLRQISI